MKITRTSQLSGITRTMEIPVIPEQLLLWQNGMKIQNAMPNLNESQREFIMTGITDQEWDEAFREGDEDDRETSGLLSWPAF